MTPGERSDLVDLEKWATISRTTLDRIARKFASSSGELEVFSAAQLVIADCLKGIEHLSAEIEAAAELSVEDLDSRPLTESDCARLLSLNRYLSEITATLRQTSVNVRKQMAAKVASPEDPMCDYELCVRIYYQLREDDPEYREDDDNFLTERSFSIKNPEENLDFEEWNCRPLPTDLRNEPHCWLFYDLYDHEHGLEKPALSFHDCLRIGIIWVDMDISQQYMFELGKDIYSGKAQTYSVEGPL